MLQRVDPKQAEPCISLGNAGKVYRPLCKPPVVGGSVHVLRLGLLPGLGGEAASQSARAVFIAPHGWICRVGMAVLC